ncbi:MAG: methyltransferase [Deltaproteobacteria bacterium]
MNNTTSQMQRPPFVPPVPLVNAALRLRRFFLRAADAVVPPYMALVDRFMGAAHTSLVDVAARLCIADHLKEGPLDAGELARRCEADADTLERVLRALVSIGVFKRLADGRFANNNVSRGMITGSEHGVRGFVRFFGSRLVSSAWQELADTVRDGKSGFNRVHGRFVWDHMAEDEDLRSAFVEGMSSMTEVVAPAIAAAYPFGEVKTVCDVGGGVGIVLAAILTRHPHLKGVLFDSESMITEARAFLESRGVADRVTTVAGSFFDTVPRGCDAYVIKMVLHNWNDENALRILRNCRAAMDPGQRLLIPDFLDEGEPFSTLVPFMDMAGLMVFGGGRERSPTVLAGLLEQTGFRFGRTWPLPGVQAVFEAIAV